MNTKVSVRINELFEKGHVHNDIEKIINSINIRQSILENLLPYQTLHTINIINSIKNNKVSIDGSYTGTGKTYTSLAACAQLNLIPFIICPKTIITKWKEVLKIFNLNYITVVNYETIRNCRMYDRKNNIVDCPYITKQEKKYIWDFSDHKRHRDIILIFDEVHKCKNHKSLNGKLLLSSKNIKTLMMSATLCDKNKDFGIFGLMLGLYKSHLQGKNWINSIVRESKNRYNKKRTNILHKYIYPEKGSHMTLEDLGDNFPMNQISIECHKLDNDSNMKVNKYYETIDRYSKSDNILGKITYMREKIENIKTSIMIDIMKEYYEKNKSIVMFVNYISSHNIITSYLDRNSISYEQIHGKQDSSERKQSLDRFQNNVIRVIICMIQSGGTSINLHDITGRFPRVSIISPSYSNIELEQTLGRIYRSGVKSPCLQKIVYCTHTYEKNMADILRKKKEFMKIITDDDINMKSNNM